jgi:hypothetical protein
MAGFGREGEAGVGKLDRQLLAAGADARRNRPVQTARPQCAGDLRGIERAGVEIERKTAGVPVAAAPQPALPRQDGLEPGNPDAVVRPVEAAAHFFQRQALAVEGAGTAVGDAEIARQRHLLAVVRPDLGAQRQAGLRRAGHPRSGVDIGQRQMRFGESVAGERRQRGLPVATQAFGRRHLEDDAFERSGGFGDQAHRLPVDLTGEGRASLHRQRCLAAKRHLTGNGDLAELAAHATQAMTDAVTGE